MNNNRKKKTQTQTPGEERLKSFLDMIAPSVIQFYTDHYICGNTFRSVWALREYPTATDEQAILRHLGEKDGVTLRIYTKTGHTGRGEKNHQQCGKQEPHETGKYRKFTGDSHGSEQPAGCDQHHCDHAPQQGAVTSYGCVSGVIRSGHG